MIVNIKIAKKLKRLGFNLPVTSYVDEEGVIQTELSYSDNFNQTWLTTKRVKLTDNDYLSMLKTKPDSFGSYPDLHISKEYLGSFNYANEYTKEEEIKIETFSLPEISVVLNWLEENFNLIIQFKYSFDKKKWKWKVTDINNTPILKTKPIFKSTKTAQKNAVSQIVTLLESSLPMN